MFNQTVGKNESGESGIRTHGRTCGPTRDFQSRNFVRKRAVCGVACGAIWGLPLLSYLMLSYL